MTKDQVLVTLLAGQVIAVIRIKNPERLTGAVAALRKGGITAIEITMSVPGAVGHIRDLVRSKGPGTLIGAGTVLDAKQAGEVIAAGADFVVSPVTDRDMIQVCRDAGVVVAPGAFTPTEIVKAWRVGADIVKVFPATSLGPQFFRDLRGPLPHIRLMPTGGVTLENTRDFLAAGACCVGIGTALVDARSVEAGAWETLETRARVLVASLESAGR
jgi:2-dehydro-3-deoxyphosphogluconate aldolase/(4S)-4-hydroxy-2-oxoglutarate aldolase